MYMYSLWKISKCRRHVYRKNYKQGAQPLQW